MTLYDCPSHLPGVHGTTLARSMVVERVTILDLSGRHDPTHFSMLVLRDAQRIGRPDRIPVGNETAGRTAIGASPGFVPFPAARAGLRRIGFVDGLNRDARRFGLVGDQLAQRAMRPVGDFLLALGFQPLAVGYVAHIAQGQHAYPALDGKVHRRAAHLVLDVADAPLLLGQEAVLALLQFLPGAGVFDLAGLQALDFCQPLVGVLPGGAQRPRRDDGRFFPVGDGDGVGWTSP